MERATLLKVDIGWADVEEVDNMEDAKLLLEDVTELELVGVEAEVLLVSDEADDLPPSAADPDPDGNGDRVVQLNSTSPWNRSINSRCSFSTTPSPPRAKNLPNSLKAALMVHSCSFRRQVTTIPVTIIPSIQ
jgi:hypothetical protein